MLSIAVACPWHCVAPPGVCRNPSLHVILEKKYVVAEVVAEVVADVVAVELCVDVAVVD